MRTERSGVDGGTGLPLPLILTKLSGGPILRIPLWACAAARCVYVFAFCVNMLFLIIDVHGRCMGRSKVCAWSGQCTAFSGGGPGIQIIGKAGSRNAPIVIAC